MRRSLKDRRSRSAILDVYDRLVSRRAWLSIAQTRVAVSISLAVGFTLFSGILGTSKPIQVYWQLVAIYCLISIGLIVFSEERLRSGRMRLFADFMDVVFVTMLICINRDFNSSVVLFYFFPIISAARYKRAAHVASFVIVAYGVVILYLGGGSAVLPGIILRCFSFLGIALVAGNLTKDRQLSEIKLVDVLREIANEIISHPEDIEKVYQLILNRAMDITDSPKGHLRKVDAAGVSKVVAHRGLPEGYEEQYYALTGRFSNQVSTTRTHVKISPLSRKHLKNRLSNYFEDRYPPPRSALFVPLIAERGNVIAVVALYSEKNIFYSKVDADRIQSFSPLLEIAEEFANLYHLVLLEAQEKQHRLRMLHELARHFEKGHLSNKALHELVDSIMERLGSEEAAMFLWERKAQRLIKHAEASPDESVTSMLKKVEDSYGLGESLTGKCFLRGEPYFSNKVTRKTQHAEEYSKHLPSRRVSHIMLIPLLVGENKIGVLRVINKKAADYDTTCSLNQAGFTEDDQNLLRTIAIEVAVALNSQHLLDEIENNRRYLERAFDYSPYPTILLDEKGLIRVFNHHCQKIWKVKTAEALKRSVKEFYASKEEARRLGRLLENAPEGQVEDEDAVVKRPSGELIQIRLSASLIKDDQGNKLGSVGVFRELSEIKKTEELKLNTERLETISRVMGYISHDVKNKLIAAGVEIDTIKKQTKRGDLPKISAGLIDLNDTLEVAINKLTNVALTQSLDINRPNRQLVYVEQIFEGCLDRWQRLAQSSRTALTINEFHKQRYQILADVDHLQMVLTNLYDNSADAIKKSKGSADRKIEIGVDANGEGVQISWTDTGCGIAENHLGRIFDVRFTTKEFGNGLGLYWAKNIVERHEGVIFVDSEEGAWTKFTIQLPLQHPEAGHENGDRRESS